VTAPQPHVVLIGGPNGAGKSTAAARLLRGALGVSEFVNADVIARGLSGFNPEGAAMEAGRIMLQRIDDLAARRADFAFETTLASRTFAPRIRDWISAGYKFYVAFLWLPSPELAIARVAARVSSGGHHVPEETIRRRYTGGLRNFFELYRPLATKWRVYNNAVATSPKLIASGRGASNERIYDRRTWEAVRRAAEAAGPTTEGH